MIETPAQILSHHADYEAVDSFIAYRKKMKKPLTERAALMLARTLAQINFEGGDGTEALDLAQEHGWQTIKPDWYWKVKNGNGNRNARSIHTDTTDRVIAVAGRTSTPPRGDCF